MNELSLAFVAAAQLMGFHAGPSRTPVAFVAPAETVVLTLPLAEVTRAQDAVFIERSSDGLAAAAAFDPAGELWIKMRQDGVTLAFSAEALAKGAVAPLPRGSYAVTLGTDGLSVKGPADAAPVLLAPEGSLLDALYDNGARVMMPIVRYAALYEPELGSVCLLRRDQAGAYWLGHHTVERLRTRPAWFLAVNGIGYALRLDGETAVFFSKPLQPLAGTAFEPERRVP
jgi:hypothetical protein